MSNDELRAWCLSTFQMGCSVSDAVLRVLNESLDLAAVVLLQQSAADMVRILEAALRKSVDPDPKRRTRQQHQALSISQSFYNSLVGAGDIKNAADLKERAEAVAKVVGRRAFVYTPPETDTADLDSY